VIRLGLSARDRRTGVVGVSVMAALILLSRGVPAWRGWVSDARAGADEQSRAVADADALVAGAGVAHDSLVARDERYMALAPALVAGGTPAEASATLASLLSETASADGVKLGAVQLRPVADIGARRTFIRVGVHADVVGDITGIATLLATLERGPLRLRVREITVTQPDAAAPGDRAEALHAELTIEGLALRRGGKAP
jgi:hypothetical protein